VGDLSLRRRLVGAMLAWFVATLLPMASASSAMAATGDVGYQDGGYSGTAPTAREPQSKLWFNDGIWWASMYSSTAKAVDIFRLDWSTQAWSDTGVRIDERVNAIADTLWDGSNLYIASGISDQSEHCPAPTTGDLGIRLLRYSYSTASKTYSLDSGFPVTLATNAATEAVSIDKDTTGTLWATWTHDNGGGRRNVYLTHSTTTTASFVVPYVMPLPGSSPLCSDTSAIVAYNGRIGVMWSNQDDSTMYFGVHVDGAPDTTWTANNALSGKGWADNHVNLKSLQADPSGQVFASTKTSLNGDQCPPSSANAQQPLILLLFMDGSGGWQRRTFSTATECESRPLVLLDPQHRQLYMFATQPAPGASYGSGGTLMYKVTSLQNPNFASGPGTPFIKLSADPKINNPTSTKQALSAASGMVVLAADDSTHKYVHNAMSLTSDTLAPTVTLVSPAEGATAVPTSSVVSAAFSEPMATGSITATTFTLTDSATNTTVPATVTYSASDTTARLTPAAPLAGDRSYVASVKGGPGGVTDLAGNPLAADSSWAFSTGGVVTVFSDGFESGNFGAWTQVRTGGDGTATVQGATVSAGADAARFTETANSGSRAYARKTLGTVANDLTIGADVDLAAEGSSRQTVPLLRLYDAAGVLLVNLYRQDASGNKISITHGGSTSLTTGLLPLNTWGRVQLHVTGGSGTGVVEAYLDGAKIYSTTTATIAPPRQIQIGNDTTKQPMTLFVDNVSAVENAVQSPAPDTTITGGPSGTVATPAASFEFSSTIGGSTFACSLDGAAASACTSPQSYSGLADGLHSFSVSATANGQTDPTPATSSWAVDTTPPTVASTSPADAATGVSISSRVTARFNEAMASSSISTSSFSLTDTTDSAAVAASVSYDATTKTATLDPTAGLAPLHTFQATIRGGSTGVTDAVGNPMAADATWTFSTAAAPDTTAPTVQVTAPAAGATVSGPTVTISATANDNVAVDHVDFLVNGTVIGTDSSSPYSAVWDSTTVANGSATIAARAVDTSTNSAIDSRSVTVSNTGSGPLFSDDFESGTFSSWTLTKTGGDGTASVQTSVVKSGSDAAAFTESSTSGSLAYVRKTLASDQAEITVNADVQVFAEGTSSQNVPLLRLFNASGTRLLSLYRQSQSGNKVYVGFNGVNSLTTGLLPLATWANVRVHVIAGSGGGTVEVFLNGTKVYASTAATIAAIRTIQFGNDTAAQPLGLYVDNVVATSP
jgi:hypothetical protein